MSDTSSWLITGGCGFIGTSLIAVLRKKNPDISIRVLDNVSVGTVDDLAQVCNHKVVRPSDLSSDRSKVQLVIGDIRDYDSCLKCCEGIDVVFHLAANTGVIPSVENPRKDMEANVVGTFNLLEASRLHKVNKFIFSSSGAPIGEATPPIHENLPAKPVSPYGAGKLAGEGYCSAYYRTFGLKTVSLRFGNVYGPGSKHKNSVVAKFFRNALNNEPLIIYGDGKQTRDFIYIDDLINAILLSVAPKPTRDNAAEPWGEIFQIATCEETTVSEIAQLIKRIVESNTEEKVNISYGEQYPGDVRRNFSNIDKAMNIIGFKPAYTLEEGLNHTFHYFFNKPDNVQ